MKLQRDLEDVYSARAAEKDSRFNERIEITPIFFLPGILINDNIHHTRMEDDLNLNQPTPGIRISPTIKTEANGVKNAPPVKRESSIAVVDLEDDSVLNTPVPFVNLPNARAVKAERKSTSPPIGSVPPIQPHYAVKSSVMPPSQLPPARQRKSRVKPKVEPTRVNAVQSTTPIDLTNVPGFPPFTNTPPLPSNPMMFQNHNLPPASNLNMVNNNNFMGLPLAPAQPASNTYAPVDASSYGQAAPSVAPVIPPSSQAREQQHVPPLVEVKVLPAAPLNDGPRDSVNLAYTNNEGDDIALEASQQDERSVQAAQLFNQQATRNFDTMEEMEAPPELTVKLEPYQKQALHWMVKQESGTVSNQRAGILADEMGLGKTVEMISLLLAQRSEDPDRKTTLIICPLSTLSQWQQEIEKKTQPGTFQVLVYYDERPTRMRILMANDIVLTTYGVVRAQYFGEDEQNGILFQANWFRVVLDEAHMIKTFKSKTAKSAFELKAKRRWAMTGTPIQNNLRDMWSLLRFIRDTNAGSVQEFNRMCELMLSDSNSSAGGIGKLRQMFYMYLLRRTKTQKIRGKTVLELPPIEITVRHLKPTPDEKLFYVAVNEQCVDLARAFAKKNTILKNMMVFFELLTRLRQTSDSNLLMLKTMTGRKEDKWKGNYGQPVEVRNDMLASLRRGDYASVNQLMQGLHSNRCWLCIEELEADVHQTQCGHVYCLSCYERWFDNVEGRNEYSDCPRCSDLHQSTENASPDAEASSQNVGQDFAARIERYIHRAAEEEERIKNDPEGEMVANQQESDYPNIPDKWFMYDDPEKGQTDIKCTKLMGLIQELEMERQKDPTTKSVVFSNFTMFLDMIEVVLENAGIHYARLDGRMPMMERERNIHAFKTEPTITVILVSIRAGGVGLNLTVATRVYIMDPWWNPAVERQAMDRVHRYGQDRPVKVVQFVVRDTVEEGIIDIQNTKKEIAMSVLGDVEYNGDMRLNIRDIRRLFRMM
ncbi:putative DNA repair protein RAD5 [Planoprotostelium fungivorum]|uniref:Putative DNA repair protein RAD5 n=1 Tax=Planoprotostelium fungivorum TaxID=1890364 RepID=A0A2P6N4D4_9EUKA|nr:putative DNA repair protein RAD5 [Planoprotostelium fungivorum]